MVLNYLLAGWWVRNACETLCLRDAELSILFCIFALVDTRSSVNAPFSVTHASADWCVWIAAQRSWRICGMWQTATLIASVRSCWRSGCRAVRACPYCTWWAGRGVRARCRSWLAPRLSSMAFPSTSRSEHTSTCGNRDSQGGTILDCTRPRDWGVRGFHQRPMRSRPGILFERVCIWAPILEITPALGIQTFLSSWWWFSKWLWLPLLPCPPSLGHCFWLVLMDQTQAFYFPLEFQEACDDTCSRCRLATGEVLSTEYECTWFNWGYKKCTWRYPL